MPFIDAASAGSSNLNAPKAWLVVNGISIPCEAATVTRKSERTADTFSATILINISAALGMSLAEWADYQPGDVSVVMSTDPTGADKTTMILGTIDEPTINWLEMTVSVSGRDKSGSLSETRRSQKFQNQSSSDIVNKIASDHGLTAAATSLSAFAGKIYTQDTVHLTLNRSDHEILSDLAEREGFRWYVDQNTLYFEPKTSQANSFALKWCPPGVVAPYGVASFSDLRTSRNMTAAKPHRMNVNSWNHKDKQKYAGTASAGGIGDPITIDHQHNGKTQAQADALAASRIKSATRHECTILAQCPGNLTVDARQSLPLSGTGTIFDQTYEIDSVEFDFISGGGLTMSIEAKTAKAGR